MHVHQMIEPVADRFEKRFWERPLSILLFIHGIAHLAGTVSALAADRDNESVSYLGGLWEISGSTQLRTFAAIWAVLGVGFVLAAGATLWQKEHWRFFVAALAAASIGLSVIALWAASFGIVLNLVVLAAVVVSQPENTNRWIW